MISTATVNQSLICHCNLGYFTQVTSFNFHKLLGVSCYYHPNIQRRKLNLLKVKNDLSKIA